MPQAVYAKAIPTMASSSSNDSTFAMAPPAMQLLCDGSLLAGQSWAATCTVLEPSSHRAHYWLGDRIRDGETWSSQGTELIAIMIALVVAIDVGFRIDRTDIEIVFDDWRVLELIQTQHFKQDAAVAGAILHWTETKILRQIAFFIEKYFEITQAKQITFRHKNGTSYEDDKWWPPHVNCKEVHASGESCRKYVEDLDPQKMPVLSQKWHTFQWSTDESDNKVVCKRQLSCSELNDMD